MSTAATYRLPARQAVFNMRSRCAAHCRAVPLTHSGSMSAQCAHVCVHPGLPLPCPALPLRSTFPACNTAFPFPLLSLTLSLSIFCLAYSLFLSFQEMHEFNMDDSSRVGWDPMLKSAWLLASGKDVAHTAEQLVVYLRRCVSHRVTA